MQSSAAVAKIGVEDFNQRDETASSTLMLAQSASFASSVTTCSCFAAANVAQRLLYAVWVNIMATASAGALAQLIRPCFFVLPYASVVLMPRQP